MMKHSIIFRLIIVPAITGVLLMAVSCNRTENSPGWTYMPDMANAIPFETYSSNPNFADSITMQMPVKGTITREMIPYGFGRTFDEQIRAGKELVNPLAVTAEALQRGSEQYAIFCANCHGIAGKGDGYLFTSGLFIAKPFDLTSDIVQAKPVGEIFHVTTVGSVSGLMGAHGSQLSQADRWKIAMYVKNKFSTNL
jgi:mono/diheme cytochrome c family protein